MRVVCPFAGPLDDRVLRALIESGRPVEYWPCGMTDDAYWWCLWDVWYHCRDAVIVEHDVVPHAGALDELEACPELWCYFPYPGWPDGLMEEMLGCTRFRSEVMERAPNLIAGFEKRHWTVLDQQLARGLRAQGLVPHRHMPPVRHLKYES